MHKEMEVGEVFRQIIVVSKLENLENAKELSQLIDQYNIYH